MDDLPDITDVVMEMGAPAEPDDPLPSPSASTRRIGPAPRPSRASCGPARSYVEVASSAGAPTPPTGAILPPGAGGRASSCCRPIRAASTSRRKPPERRPGTASPARCRRSSAGAHVLLLCAALIGSRGRRKLRPSARLFHQWRESVGAGRFRLCVGRRGRTLRASRHGYADAATHRARPQCRALLLPVDRAGAVRRRGAGAPLGPARHAWSPEDRASCRRGGGAGRVRQAGRGQAPARLSPAGRTLSGGARTRLEKWRQLQES